jgi:trehalose 6-phosphate synthase
MRRLVVVSNRLPQTSGSARGEEPRGMPVGGLATALRGALKRSPGSLWLGWSGATTSAADPRVVRETVDGIRVIGLSLTQREVAEYYRGFCNEVLWPLFHGFVGRVRLDRADEACYRRVSERFALVLRPMLSPGDVVWVHDYHLIRLGQDLRRAGWNGPVGFFLHVPFPAHDLWEVLPEPRELLTSMMDYDLVGVQTRAALDNYVDCCRRELGAQWDGTRIVAGDRTQRAGAYPIGIDPEAFRPPAEGQRRDRPRGELTRVVRGRRLILGVDRLDYTKGIPERLVAFETLLKSFPRWRRKVSFVQIASPTRSRIPRYAEQKQKVDLMVGRINGEMADHDWLPVRYLYRTYPQEVLARFYREADVGLVTPLRDGMNLIAKEFVAAQNPDSPGVLVLSRFAGAAAEMAEAVLVNSHMPSDTAEGIDRALAMPLEERRERHRALLSRVVAGTAEAWSRRFLDDLEAAAGPTGRRHRAAPHSPFARHILTR